MLKQKPRTPSPLFWQVPLLKEDRFPYSYGLFLKQQKMVSLHFKFCPYSLPFLELCKSFKKSIYFKVIPELQKSWKDNTRNTLYPHPDSLDIYNWSHLSYYFLSLCTCTHMYTHTHIYNTYILFLNHLRVNYRQDKPFYP